MTTRKITLLAVFAFLLAVCIIQGITGAINPVKTIKTDAEPDAITISKDGKTVELTKNGFGWQVGSENYIANKSDVEKMIKEIQEVEILDKILCGLLRMEKKSSRLCLEKPALPARRLMAQFRAKKIFFFFQAT